MWYAYEGENDLIALKAEDIKKIIEMNRAQQYPERMEDFQVQLMSTSALEQESSNAEFESELSRLADNGSTAATTDRRQQHGGRRDSENQKNRKADNPSERRNQHGDRRQPRDNNDRQPRDKGPRPPRDRNDRQPSDKKKKQ